jgi:hypothetical protein
VTPTQMIVYGHLNKWRNLRAWGRSLDKLDLTVSTRSYTKRAGTCWPQLQKVNVYHQEGLRGLVAMLKTGLHEFAHAIEGKDGHGLKWQERYARAVSEVTGHYVGWGSEALDENCYRAMLKWWRASGAEAHAKKYL